MSKKTLKEHILEALDDLTKDQLERFKSKLNEAEVEPEFNRIPRGTLEDAKPLKLAETIVNFYREEYGARLTAGILGEINEKRVADRLLKALEDGARGNSVPPATNSQWEAGARSALTELPFVDQHREALIARTSLVEPILDKLLDKNLLTQEQYDVIRSKDTSQNKMRALYGFVHGWGRADKDRLYEALKAENGCLIRDLGGR